MFITVPRRWQVWNTRDQHYQMIEQGRYEVEERLIEGAMVDPSGRIPKTNFLMIKDTDLGLGRSLWESQAQCSLPEFRVIIER